MENEILTAADLAPCPFCGGECYVLRTQARRRVRCMNAECSYHGAAFNPADEAAAVTAHNTLSRRAALFPELVALLERVDVCDQEDGEDWWSDRAALLKRAAEITPEVQR